MGYSWRVSVLGHIVSINFNAYCGNVLVWKKERASSSLISETKTAVDLVASLKRVLLYVLVLHLLNYFTGVLVKYTRVCVFTKGPSWLKCVCGEVFRYMVKYPAAQKCSSIQL